MTSSDVHSDSGVMTESHTTPTKAPKTILFLLKTCLTCVECRKEYQKRELAAWNKPKGSRKTSKEFKITSFQSTSGPMRLFVHSERVQPQQTTQVQYLKMHFVICIFMHF